MKKRNWKKWVFWAMLFFGGLLFIRGIDDIFTKILK